jgi:hypothetical protein
LQRELTKRLQHDYKYLTVSFGQTFTQVTVFDPTVGTDPILSSPFANLSSITIPISDHPIILQLRNPSTGPATHFALTAASGSFNVTAPAAQPSVSRNLAGAEGVVTVTGSPSMAGGFGQQLAAAPGSFVVTPPAVQIKVTYQLVAATGLFALSTARAVLQTARKFTPPAGVLAISGRNAVTAYIGGAPIIDRAGVY